MLKNLSKVLSVFVGLTIINVWLFRSNRSTSYRGGDATNLIEEFAVYGLEDYFLIIGIIKVSLAIILILSLYYNKLRLFASLGIAIMMLVAINMHMSVGDELIKLTPAATMLISSLLIVYSTKNSK
ncbi:MAG: DoxX family protein [Cryomorphaceae bacterium]|jgi:Na+-transporting NADH:ubiquinone oxidoreductase subunit NqrD|nr:DoxX family protein [Cryomorphaceae bacterium]MDG1889139.1 DoxX family protein [Flavobacteriaceae bacterium]MBT3503072.1 DoxX family protein [Cryomorphaceae bacterium]MBT3689593.1 DoxX family protein [Cryomorphaceae bacterium]MBT4222769.1 DoxX family protein [Cryomorphaceae bacterium]|tara:strand:+ start:89 stop:466 length:378 start_codon:yes stop_codon:yes gene_type:complete